MTRNHNWDRVRTNRVTNRTGIQWSTHTLGNPLIRTQLAVRHTEKHSPDLPLEHRPLRQIERHVKGVSLACKIVE